MSEATNITPEPVIFRDLELSRLIPAHVERHGFNWLHRTFTTISIRHRRIRERCGGTMLKCHWCNHKFENGEIIGLAQPKEKGKGNWALCQACCDEMEKSS